MTTTEEWIVTAKTRLVFYQEVEQTIRHLHPYEEPGIVSFPMIAGSTSYFSWIAKETTLETQQAMKTSGGSAKAHLIQTFDEAYKKLIAAATKATRQDRQAQGNEWGPREILAHIVGWAAQATAFIPQILAGLPAQTYASELQHTAIDEAFNTAFITILGNQSFEQVLTLAHQTHQRFVQMLREQDE